MSKELLKEMYTGYKMKEGLGDKPVEDPKVKAFDVALLKQIDDAGYDIEAIAKVLLEEEPVQDYDEDNNGMSTQMFTVEFITPEGITDLDSQTVQNSCEIYEHLEAMTECNTHNDEMDIKSVVVSGNKYVVEVEVSSEI